MLVVVSALKQIATSATKHQQHLETGALVGQLDLIIRLVAVVSVVYKPPIISGNPTIMQVLCLLSRLKDPDPTSLPDSRPVAQTLAIINCPEKPVLADIIHVVPDSSVHSTGQYAGNGLPHP
ncbi:hypothetical protein ATANTOWER_024793 [Ataeniobius toweri]|uniref:Uncharacterized protein n=1 Tax=Ataeniobius toweri TaxID=208326 RepID=A0ABU7AT76_9TELE|nr:hypothetical protein [Ataeniobius toweri]